MMLRERTLPNISQPRKTRNGAKAYVLIRTHPSRSEQAVGALLRQTGVVSVDMVDGPHDVILTMEASDREKLAGILMGVLSSVESMTDDMELLIVQDIWQRHSASPEF